MIIKIFQGNFRLMCIGELDESFPNFGFLEDKYFDNFTILAEELVEIIMCYYIPIFVIDTYKEDRAINLRIHAKKVKILYYNW